jgi:protoporphyrinogen/coproporphyrinogen III oxidase
MIVGYSLVHVLRELGVKRSLVLPLLRRGGSVDPPVACSFREGMQTLPDALYRSNRENVCLGTAVRSLRRCEGRWELETEGGTLSAERVVLSVPAGAAAALLAREAPGQADALRRLVYNPLAVVHLHADTDLEGLGYQVALAEPLVTRGVTFNDSIFARPGVYTTYLGGGKRPEVVEWSDEELGVVAAREFRLVTGFLSRPISVEREWMPSWDRSWASVQDLRPPSGLRFATNWESRPGLPGRLAQAKRIAGDLAREAGIQGQTGG